MTIVKTNTALLILALAMMLPAVSPAQTILIEAENYTSYYDFAFEPIRVLYATGNSDSMLYGLDTVDEWVEYQFAVSAFGDYSFNLHCKGDQGWPYTFQVWLTGGTTGHVQVLDVQFTGTGYG
jgi:hypothetical protein